ncbi:BnaCnng53270D [Brassica napus]|uniref:BnaCnng53270D protein n=1 Tax=Brassica napus TaxID=3708 RepID=A0A078JHE2_BRANA|nr:BnaCnng53270D [Brassica napus]
MFFFVKLIVKKKDSGGVLLLLNRSLRNHVSLRISFSINSPNTTAARTSPITEALASPIWNILSQLYFKQTNRDFSDTSTFSVKFHTFSCLSTLKFYELVL